MTVEVILSVEGLSISSPHRLLVSGVSLEVRRGEIVGIVGESGSGKSLSVTAIAGLLADGVAISGGTIDLHDDSGAPTRLTGLSAARYEALRGERIGMVFQDPSSYLDPLVSVRGHLLEALWREPGPRAARIERARELLTDVALPGTDEFLRAYPHQLSGGQKQRVLIAAAIAQRPALLIADEPTTALDVSVQFAVLNLIKGLRDRYGISVLLITHDLGVVAQTCDRVYVMRAGEIVETADVLDLFEKPAHPYTRELLAASFLQERS